MLAKNEQHYAPCKSHVNASLVCRTTQIPYIEQGKNHGRTMILYGVSYSAYTVL